MTKPVAKFPPFARMGKKGTIMRLITSDTDRDGLGWLFDDRLSKQHAYYYRDAGAWGTKAKYIKGVLTSFGFDRSMSYLNGRIMSPCTKSTWKKDNGEYAPDL